MLAIICTMLLSLLLLVPDSHRLQLETCLLLLYMQCLLPILYLKHYSMIFVTLCLKLNFARIIYVVICVAWYHLGKTLAIFSTTFILSLSWWFTSIWWEYSILTSFEEKFLQICFIYIRLWHDRWYGAINNRKEKMEACVNWHINFDL